MGPLVSVATLPDRRDETDFLCNFGRRKLFREVMVKDF